MSIANPHQLEPVAEGLYCWRVNQQNGWNAKLYPCEDSALLAAQEYCKSNLGIGKHTIYLGVTRNDPVDCSALIQRYIETASQAWEYDSLFRAMCLPKSKWAETAKAIGRAVAPELINATKACVGTHILKVRHVFFSVTPAVVGIESCTVELLVADIRTEYKLMSPDWLKVSRLQQLLCNHADEVIERCSLPLSIESMRIWQGFDRTKDRLHIVCEAPYELGRFERSEGDTLCQKSPKKDGDAQETDLPCLVCMDRLVKIEKSLNN